MTGHKKYIQFSGNMVQSPPSVKRARSWSELEDGVEIVQEIEDFKYLILGGVWVNRKLSSNVRLVCLEKLAKRQKSGLER